ncbi:MAG TPA: hypothetical protein ENH47_00920 [Ignavibacteriales bacterium]|nr:hypothetical protein [Ignavibacteriales bacterium]
MLHKTSKLVLTLAITLLIATGLSFAQEHNSNDQKKGEMKEHMSGQKNMDHKMMDSTKTGTMKMNKSIVRLGVIDLEAIDKNGDGKVFQDVMDWNVISDEPAECPRCGMKLKEVTLGKAKFNLIKNGFEVK